jgi:S-adenosylmethionine synthetase
VDRSAAYAVRWVAKNIVAAKLARRCEVQVAYAIGVRDPVSIMVETFGTGQVPDAALERAVRDVFDLTPGGIMQRLGLRSPIYRPTAAYGHFGREAAPGTVGGQAVKYFSWEDPSMAAVLRDAAQRAA